MRLSALQKDATFALAILFSLGVALNLNFEGIAPFYLTAPLAVLTILVPLWIAFYFYKGKPARLFAFLAGFAVFCALVFAVDALASLQGFKNFCAGLGDGSQFTKQADSYICTPPSGADYIGGDMFTTSLSGGLLVLYFGAVLFNAGHLAYLPLRAALKRFKKKR